MSEVKTKNSKQKSKKSEDFSLKSPYSSDTFPDQSNKDDIVRINLFVSKEMHKRLRIYAINHDDKSLVVTIQDILDKYLKAEGY